MSLTSETPKLIMLAISTGVSVQYYLMLAMCFTLPNKVIMSHDWLFF